MFMHIYYINPVEVKKVKLGKEISMLINAQKNHIQF